MGLVHTLVAEVLSHFVYALETSDDETLEVELGSDAHVHILVQRIEMRHEGACTGTSCNVLEDGGVHFGISGLVQDAADGAYDGGALEEGFLDTAVDDKVHVALTVTEFGVIEGVEHLSAGLFYHGQRLEALTQEGQRVGMYTDFAGLCAEDVAADTYKVAQVEQFLEHDVVEVLVLARTNFVALDIYLYPSARILYFGKSSLSHNASAHKASGDGYIAAVFGVCSHPQGLSLLVGHGLAVFIGLEREVGKLFADVIAPGVDGEFCCRVRFNAAFAELCERCPAGNLLFAEFKINHLSYRIAVVFVERGDIRYLMQGVSDVSDILCKNSVFLQIPPVIPVFFEFSGTSIGNA